MSFEIPEKLYRIGEIMERTRISRQTLHNYTVWGLITESRRTAGNHRLYPESVFERLALIQKLKKTLTIAQIKEDLFQEDRLSNRREGKEVDAGRNV
ncbi:MAG: MerR family transcriptional regulator [Planctomycetota bacterium]